MIENDRDNNKTSGDASDTDGHITMVKIIIQIKKLVMPLYGINQRHEATYKSKQTNTQYNTRIEQPRNNTNTQQEKETETITENSKQGRK